MVANQFIKYLAGLFLVLLVTSCNPFSQPAAFSTELDGKVCMNLPVGFVETGNMHDHSTFQFRHPEKNIFLLGFSDSKRKIRKMIPNLGIEDYLDFVSRNVRANLDSVWNASGSTLFPLGLKGKLREIRGIERETNNPMDMTYVIGVIENKTDFFQVVGWCQSNESESLCLAMEDMVGSAAQAENNSGNEAEGGR